MKRWQDERRKRIWVHPSTVLVEFIRSLQLPVSERSVRASLTE
jgi:hypothetical protein